MTTKKINKGFTLIEVLLVMVLIGVLLSIGLVSLNTEDRLIETRNNTRQTHIQTLESAITQYKLQEGNYPTGLNRTYQEICDPEATVCTGFFDIKPFLVPTYIQAIPQDPNDSDTTGGSGYEVAVDIATNTVSVRLKATLQEAGVEIKINDPLPAEPTVTANTQLAATVPNLPPVTAVTATGGNITTINENGTWYKVHTFLTSGTFEVTTGGEVEYLVVGGGGSGGNRGGGAGGGGGGAGGFRTGTGFSVTPQDYPITVGAGGTAVGDNSVSGNSGNPSVFSSITSAGGGRGGKYGTSGDGGTGGSGGGGGRDNGGQGSAGNVPSTSPSQGNAGGNSGSGGAGGGGGAGAVGVVGANNVGGAGGAGTVSSISGAPVTYAGGGGGGGQNSGGTGGSGIGGNGGYDSNNAGTAGMVNTGSGGGGGGSGAGGSGIVIIRYPTTAPPTPTVTATGGTITTINENGIWYKVHTFLTNGTFTVTNGGNVEYLVVGGGGGGGDNGGGGGGAGGFRTGTLSVNAGNISVVIGPGGNKDYPRRGTKGGDSIFGSITSAGGGGGGTRDGSEGTGGAGGSGGGGGGVDGPQSGGAGNTPSTSPSQGNSGGTNSGSQGNQSGAGGGGAGGVGMTGTPGGKAGNGGDGLASSISGVLTYYAGGGGGTGTSTGTAGNGGVGGGGAGGAAATPNTGGGGGGSGGGGGWSGGPGGSGIVIIRYPTTAPPAPTIVTNGRVLDLDAGNTASYPGTGTTWTDLSGSGKTGTLVGSPTYNPDNGGSLVFNGSNWVTIANSFSSPSIPTGSSDRTIVACFKPSSISAGYNHIMHYGNTASDQSYGITTYGGFISTHTWAGAAQFSNYPAVANSIYCVTLTYNNARSPRNIFFVNGSFGTTTYGQGKNDDYVINTGTGNGLIVGNRITGGEAYNGNIYRIIIYDRVLTDTEIQQNYNALKGRFGL